MGVTAYAASDLLLVVGPQRLDIDSARSFEWLQRVRVICRHRARPTVAIQIYQTGVVHHYSSLLNYIGSGSSAHRSHTCGGITLICSSYHDNDLQSHIFPHNYLTPL